MLFIFPLFSISMHLNVLKSPFQLIRVTTFRKISSPQFNYRLLSIPASTDGAIEQHLPLEKTEQFVNSTIHSTYATKEVISELKNAVTLFLHKSVAPSEFELKSIQERQLGQNVTNIFAVESEKCMHGYPRAFMRAPEFQSSMLRLSCPHLVKAIDRFEFEQKGIEKINSTLSIDGIIDQDNAEQKRILRANFLETNQIWKKIRISLLPEEKKKEIHEKLGNKAGDSLINSGIIGISIEKVDDAKCLHAHVADYLLRGENLIGKWALNEMEEKHYVNPGGCKDCWQQCSLQHERTKDSWWYMSKKNKQKLRTRKINRYLSKVKVKAKRGSHFIENIKDKLF